MRTVFLSGRQVSLFVVAILVALNGMLIWRDYQNKKILVELQLSLQQTRVELRVSKSINLFGAAFIPLIDTVDLYGKDTKIPGFGTQSMVVLFFKPWDCNSCLRNLSLFESTIGENVPVVGIAQASSVSDVNQAIMDYGYEFPIYVAKEMPFNQLGSVYCVLVNRNRSVLYLAEIESNPNTVLAVFREMEQILNPGNQ